MNPFLFPVGIVAHREREKYAFELAESLQAECISMDDHDSGAGWNHTRLLRYMKDCPSEWVVILEDDAVPTEEFRRQLQMALNWAPTPFVGFYVGRGRPPHWQAGISAVMAKDVCWLTCDTLMNAVGYAVKTKLIPSVLRHLDSTWKTSPKLPVDEALSRWGQDSGVKFSYTRPSLIDHRDIKPVEKHTYTLTEKRVAWLFGSRKVWSGSTASLEYVESW